jgi:hypothetical protein
MSGVSDNGTFLRVVSISLVKVITLPTSKVGDFIKVWRENAGK